MGLDRLDCVLRTGRGIAAMASQQRAYQVTIDSNGKNQDFAHVFIMLFQCCSSAALTAADSTVNISRLTITTMSRGGNSCWRRRKLSRNRRFSALRLTARGICFRAIANPSRGPAPVFLPTRIVIQASLRRKLFLKTCWKSIARVSLSRLGKASLTLALTLWRQSSSTFRPA